MSYSNQYYSGERVNSLRKASSASPDFNRFISNSKSQLRKGETVFVYCKEQLDVLQNIFGESLTVTYNKNQNVWVCFLKEVY